MNEMLYCWRFNFHKVVWQKNSGAVEDFILPYSAVYLRIQRWKNYWNLSVFAKVIHQRITAYFFWPTLYMAVYPKRIYRRIALLLFVVLVAQRFCVRLVIERSLVRLPAGALYQVNYKSTQPSIPPGYVNGVPACMAEVRRGAFTCVGWQVTLCDPIWQVTSHRPSSEMGFSWRAISALTFFTFIAWIP